MYHETFEIALPILFLSVSVKGVLIFIIETAKETACSQSNLENNIMIRGESLDFVEFRKWFCSLTYND